MKFNLLLPNVEISGGNRANFELANALIEQGHAVEIFYPLIPGRDGLGWMNIRKTLVQVVKGVRNSFSGQTWFDLKARLTPLPFFSANQLQARLPDADYLIVSWWAHVELLSSLAPRLGKPVHLIRSLEFWGGPLSLVTAAYEQPLIKLVTSNALRLQYESRFGAVNGIVPDGVSLELFSPGENRAPEGTVTIGMMYRRQPLKRMKDGIDALARVAAQDPQVRIKLFGERLKAEDRKLLETIPHWKHEIFPTGEALRDIYRSLDIFLFPSGPEEAFGLPPLEAMASGCAVVSTRVGAVEEYSTDGTTALMCPPGDIETMSALLIELVEDPSKRQEISEAAINRVEAYSWQRSANSLLEVLTDVNTIR
jgi:glycosyltransferase involved in cell wall biosynthesis